MSAAAVALERFLRRRLPDCDIRVIDADDSLTVRYGVPQDRGRRFPVLFTLRRERGRWVADREVDGGLIGAAVKYLAFASS